ncbi:zinc-binding dehydrogenase [Sphingobium sp. MK2]|uniref:quinone oxidoreductase family protein n=1 Tax=Sphingobium sp. MK2 TaxID=3116540 RepID=UPI0032E367C2
MAKMNTVRFHEHGPPEVLRYEQVERPVPGPGEALVRISTIGVNYGDVMRRQAPDLYPMPSPLPWTCGGEAVGTVVEVGEGISPTILGQRSVVFPGKGCYSDYTVVPINRVYGISSELSDAQAIALFVQGLTAAFILRHSARLAPGEAVLVQGAAGGVGSLAVQLAKIQGAGLVIGCAGSAEKCRLVESLGADLAVNYTDPDWAEQVRAFTGGAGVDVVLEMTGGKVAEDSLGLLRMFGRSVVFGHTSGGALAIDMGMLPQRNLSVIGFYMRPYLDIGTLVADTLAEFADHVASGRLQVQLGGSFPLSRAADAHRQLESRSTTGKLVLIPDA